MAKTFLMLAALSGALAVIIGAFGAHALKARVAVDLLAVYETGVQYHFYHTFALGIAGLLLIQFPQVVQFIWSGWAFVVGIVVFSGSLYLMALTDMRWLGAITPVGGFSFILAWVLLAVGVYNNG